MEFFYFLGVAFLVNFILLAIEICGPCDKGGFHDWYMYDCKHGTLKDSGMVFGYTYCESYRCKKCGKTDMWQDRR